MAPVRALRRDAEPASRLGLLAELGLPFAQCPFGREIEVVRFVVGMIVVAVALFAYFAWTGYFDDVQVPSAPRPSPATLDDGSRDSKK